MFISQNILTPLLVQKIKFSSWENTEISMEISVPSTFASFWFWEHSIPTKT